MKPIIGITASHHHEKRQSVNDTYVQAVIRAGGIPVMLPTGVEADIQQLIEAFDGFIFTGGGDIDPTFFREEPALQLGEVEPARDAFEIPFARAVVASNKPLLGVCRGMQVLNVALGGNLYQDIETQKEETILQHKQQAPTDHPSHFVQLTEGSFIRQIMGEETIKVNSFHHQAVKKVPQPLQISGVANDGIIEAIESRIHPFVVGVQWHPEALIERADECAFRLFKAFVEKSKEGRD